MKSKRLKVDCDGFQNSSSLIGFGNPGVDDRDNKYFMQAFRFFIYTILFIGIFEAIIMTVFSYITLPKIIENITDALLLSIMTGPILYYLSFRPLIKELKKSVKAESLLESEERYRTLAESAPDSIFILDAQERFIYINKLGAGQFGMPAELINGKTIKEVFNFSDPKLRKYFEAIMRVKKPLLFEDQISFPIGNRWVEVRLNPLLNEKGEVLRVMGVSRDITDRKQSEAQIHLQSEALNATANGIVITDNVGSIIWVNPAFSEMTGYSLEEVKGKNPRILKSGEQNENYYKDLWSTIASGNSWTGELINRRKDGTLYFEKQTITPIKNNEGTITHFIAVKKDISAEKKIELQFRQTQKIEVVGRLAGGVAHDFNNLLTVIEGNAELLLSSSPTATIQEGLHEIRNACERAAKLTRQLLTFSRKQIYQIKIIDLNEIVLGADKMIRRLLGEDIELVTLLGENLKPLKLDPAQVEQIILNLVVNARDAMSKGGKIVIETSNVIADKKITSEYAGLVPGEYVTLKIQDNGCGMSSDVMAHIFEPFFTTKEKGKGTGLGLATVYGITQQFKGHIFVKSELKKGTTFILFLPPTEEKLVTQERFCSFEKLPVGKETILVVEDEDLIRALTVQVLTRQGFSVLEARNGLEALAIAQQKKENPIQILFSDMVMQYMGGSELAEKFLALYPDTKIVFTSGYVDQTAVQKWIDQGYLFLQKPFTHAELLLIIREAIDSKLVKTR